MTPFRFLHGLLLLLLLGIDADCAYPPTIPLEVEYDRCRAVLPPGPICVLGSKRELRLWVGAPREAQIEIRAGGEQIDVAGEPVQDGQRFSLTLSTGAERVDVLVEAPQGKASWSLFLAEPEGEELRRQSRPGEAHDLLGEVKKMTLLVNDYIQDRKLAAARKMLRSFQLPHAAPAKARFLVYFYRGQLAEREGDYRSALEEVQKAVRIAERVKLDPHQWMAEEQLALLFLGMGRFREAAQLFDRLRLTPHGTDSCEEAQLLNNQAWSVLLAREAGESSADSIDLFEKALKTYETCGRFTADKRFNLLINLALAHLQERRLPQAKDFLARADKLGQSAKLYQKLWWHDLEARTALQDGLPEEALHRFEDLDELALATGSADGRLRAALGKARSQKALGDQTTALETLWKAEALLDEQSLQIPLHEGRETFMATRQAVVSLHVELLLEQDRRAEALAVARHGRSRMLWQLERGDRLASLTPEERKQWDLLLTEYQQKRAALEERAKDEWKLPENQVHRERAAGKAEAEAAKKLLDQAFLILGDPGERLGKEPPPPPSPGELILAYQPLSRGWVGFASDGKTVAVYRFELPPELSRLDELAQRMLHPFYTLIKKARRIRILASGPLQDVDFHALPFDGDILLARCPVVYGLDVTASSDSPQPPGRHALLVADPRDDLPGALAETRAVGRILESGARPWMTEELRSTKASVEAVRDRFATADLLHYAGHGTFSGFGGWESGLLLAEETRLTLGDILALERVPAWVVLSGCETGRSSAETPVESLGLAQAFLLAGSRGVVASTRPADDRAVPMFFTDLYRQWDREPDLAVAFQRAQLSWRERDRKADWRGFRVFVR